jgi:hypothetical protein
VHTHMAACIRLFLYRHGSRAVLLPVRSATRASSGRRGFAIRGSGSLRTGRADCQAFTLKPFDRMTTHALHTLAEIGGVLEWAMRGTFVENGFRACRTDALDTAQRIFIRSVDVDRCECVTTRRAVPPEPAIF